MPFIQLIFEDHNQVFDSPPFITTYCLIIVCKEKDVMNFGVPGLNLRLRHELLSYNYTDLINKSIKGEIDDTSLHASIEADISSLFLFFFSWFSFTCTYL